MERNGKQNLNR